MSIFNTIIKGGSIVVNKLTTTSGSTTYTLEKNVRPDFILAFNNNLAITDSSGYYQIALVGGKSVTGVRFYRIPGAANIVNSSNNTAWSFDTSTKVLTLPYKYNILWYIQA